MPTFLGHRPTWSTFWLKANPAKRGKRPIGVRDLAAVHAIDPQWREDLICGQPSMKCAGETWAANSAFVEPEQEYGLVPRDEMSDAGRGGCRPIALAGRCVDLDVGQRPSCGRGGSAGGRGGLGYGGGFGFVGISPTLGNSSVRENPTIAPRSRRSPPPEP
jgi:hypothetical protein